MCSSRDRVRFKAKPCSLPHHSFRWPPRSRCTRVVRFGSLRCRTRRHRAATTTRLSFSSAPRARGSASSCVGSRWEAAAARRHRWRGFRLPRAAAAAPRRPRFVARSRIITSFREMRTWMGRRTMMRRRRGSIREFYNCFMTEYFTNLMMLMNLIIFLFVVGGSSRIRTTRS